MFQLIHVLVLHLARQCVAQPLIKILLLWMTPTKILFKEQLQTPDGLTAIFTPSNELSPKTTCTATVTSGVTDQTGNPMASDKTWSFITADIQIDAILTNKNTYS
jgi:hypothetical protein